MNAFLHLLHRGRATARHGLILAAALLASGVTAYPQNWSIDWWTTDGGGGTSRGGDYSLSGTIGQPDSGRMSGGQYAVEGGFWGLSTTATPELAITNSVGTVIVSWPLWATGFVLEETRTLDSKPFSWSEVWATNYQSNATDYYLTVPAPQGKRFYRLRKP
jgi:hypothetical protein